MYDDEVFLQEMLTRSQREARNAGIMLNITFGLFALTILTVLGLLIVRS